MQCVQNVYRYFFLSRITLVTYKNKIWKVTITGGVENEGETSVRNCGSVGGEMANYPMWLMNNFMSFCALFIYRYVNQAGNSAVYD